jgi:hypothetical protein
MNCASCDKELKLVSDDMPMRRRTDWTFQYDNALAIQFHSGYGMFFDNLDFLTLGANPTRDQSLVICHDCGHALIEANPWMRKVVDDKRGHAHNGEAHPE